MRKTTEGLLSVFHLICSHYSLTARLVTSDNPPAAFVRAPSFTALCRVISRPAKEGALNIVRRVGTFDSANGSQSNERVLGQTDRTEFCITLEFWSLNSIFFCSTFDVSISESAAARPGSLSLSQAAGKHSAPDGASRQ